MGDVRGCAPIPPSLPSSVPPPPQTWLLPSLTPHTVQLHFLPSPIETLIFFAPDCPVTRFLISHSANVVLLFSTLIEFIASLPPHNLGEMSSSSSVVSATPLPLPVHFHNASSFMQSQVLTTSTLYSIQSGSHSPFSSLRLTSPHRFPKRCNL